jgi:hypothetical protein
MTMNLHENPFSPGDEEKIVATAIELLKTGGV